MDQQGVGEVEGWLEKVGENWAEFDPRAVHPLVWLKGKVGELLTPPVDPNASAPLDPPVSPAVEAALDTPRIPAEDI